MKPLHALALTLLTACSHVPLDRAVVGHNIFRQVLVEASAVFAPAYEIAHAEAIQREKEADYVRDMAPYNGVVSALRDGKEAEQILHDALNVCIAKNDVTCDLARLGFACAASSLDLISESYGQVRGGATLYAAAAIAEVQLRELAQDMKCEKP